MHEIWKNIQPNSPEEEARIQRGIDMDPTTYVLTDEEFQQLRPFRIRPSEAFDVFPETS